MTVPGPQLSSQTGAEKVFDSLSCSNTTPLCLYRLQGHAYLVYANKLTGWLEATHLAKGTALCAIMDQLRRHYVRWGAPEQLSMDGGTDLGSEEMKAFLKKWGVCVRLSSAYHPQSNGRAEAALKSAKRVLLDNVGADGSTDNDKTSLGLLQYLNTPLPDIDKSPAQLASGQQLRDGVPVIRHKLQVDKFLGKMLRQMERQVAQHFRELVAERGNTRSHKPLTPGSKLMVQDQAIKVWNR